MVFENKYSSQFLQKANEVCKKLEIPTNWLIAVIEFETAGTFSPSIENSLGYVGLIQFGKDAAERCGTTQSQLKQMSDVEQLDYVYKYYVIYKSKIKSYVDLYIATLFPVALGKPKNYILQTSRLTAERVATANPYFDINKDKKITVGEIEEKLLKRIPEPLPEEFKKKKCQQCGFLQ